MARQLARVSWAAALILICLPGCGDESTSGPPTESPPADIDRFLWSLVATMEFQPREEPAHKCTIDGSVRFLRTGAAAHEGEVRRSSVFCSSSPFPHPDINGVMTNVQVLGNEVTFETEHCRWSGTASGRPADWIQGGVDCSIPFVGSDPLLVSGNFVLDIGGRPLSPTPDLTGNWVLVSAVTYQFGGCAIGGDVQVDQREDDISGTVSDSWMGCPIFLGSNVFNVNGPLAGTVNLTDRESVRLSIRFCELVGVLSGNPATRIDGEATCLRYEDGSPDPVRLVGPFRLMRTQVSRAAE